MPEKINCGRKNHVYRRKRQIRTVVGCGHDQKDNDSAEHHHLRRAVSFLITPELFEVAHSAPDKETLLHSMAEKLRQNGYVGESFEEEVLERDRMSYTAFGMFAIPHAMKMHELRNGMNIMILEEPVNWDEKPVQLVMMLCFNRNERYIFNEVFEPLSMILSDRDKLKAALTCRTSEEFIGTIANFLE